MNRNVSLIIILVLGVIALALLYVLTEKSRKEQFNDNENENENENQPVNPHRLHLAPNSDSCENLLDKKGFVSVQEFMDGERYMCY